MEGFREGTRKDPTPYHHRSARVPAKQLHALLDAHGSPSSPDPAAPGAERNRTVRQTPPALAFAPARPRPGAVPAARRHRRPGPSRCQSRPACSWRPAAVPARRAGSKDPGLPATAPKKAAAAAAAAPPRAPAPGASPRPRRLAPVRALGASPCRQSARLPDGQEGRQKAPTHGHPPALAAPGYRQEPRLRHPPRSPSFLLLLRLRSDAAQPPPPARPSPTRPAPPAPPLTFAPTAPPHPSGAG